MGKGAFAPFESPRYAQAVALNLILLCEGDIEGLIAKRLSFRARAKASAKKAPGQSPGGRSFRHLFLLDLMVYYMP